MMKYLSRPPWSIALLVGVWLLAACQPVNLPNTVNNQVDEKKLPADGEQAVDYFIAHQKIHEQPDSAVATFTQLAATYTYARDSYAHAAIKTYSAQAWDKKRQGDSMISVCAEALLYFDHHPEEVDMRSMCHLYTGWGYYYKKNQLTANYYFSLAGNDITDTVYLPAQKTFATSHYPAVTKAALLAEIAAYAIGSKLNEQACHYMELSLQSLEAAPDASPDLKAMIWLGATDVYTSSKKLDSAGIYLRRAGRWVGHTSDQQVNESFLENAAAYYMARKQYDRCRTVNQKLLRLYEADTADKSNEIALAKLRLADACIYTGDYKQANLLIAQSKPVLYDDTTVLTFAREAFLETKLRYIVAVNNGSEFLEAYTAVKDAFFDQQRLEMISDMNARYNLSHKQNNINKLSNDNHRYARTVRRQTVLLIVAILSVLLLAALVVIIWQSEARRHLKAEKDKIELEQRLLRSQMEPHFIFNTLSVLQGLIRRDEKELSIKYLNQFARLLRISLEHARESFVPLRSEIEALQHYLSLQQVRFRDVFNFSIETYPDYEEDGNDLKIPPMLIQPFAENAVHYGMEGKQNFSGSIRIRIEKTGKAIVCTLEDNGTTPKESTKASGSNKRSLSTLITQERLNLLSKKTGEPASLEVRQLAHGGMYVRLVIPYLVAS